MFVILMIAVLIGGIFALRKLGEEEDICKYGYKDEEEEEEE